MEITLSDSNSAIIPAEIANEKCKVLIDTGASRSFMREDYFKKLPNAKLMPTLRDVRIRSATGRDVQTLGRTITQFKLGVTTYTAEFIICRNLRRPAILGIDFLRKNRLGTTWTEEGKFALQKGDDILVESIEVFFEDTYPKLKAIKHMDIQARSIVVITTRADFQIQDQGKIFEVKPIEEFTVNHPNLITLPIIHKTDTEHRENVPYLLINLSNDDEHILKGEEIAIMEELMINSDQIYKEADKQENGEQLKSDLKVRKNEIHFEEEINYMDDELVIKPCESDEEEELEKKFITSPADVETQRKVKLQDAYITEIDKARFRCLCNEFEDIFSKSSEDIGHTPLVTMDIDTGDSPPVCQKPYSLPLKHVEWVQKELEILERAGVIQRSMSPWASPIVIVPKKTEPGEPPRRRMCVDYRMLNSLLPPVNKAHSKAKGIVTLVPLPKIDEIYAQLQGSKIFSALDMRSGYFHIELSEEAKPKTAFVPGGPHGSKYQFNRCPFGLSQAPAYFQRLVHEVLRGLPFTFGYLDDILIFSSGVEAHLEHLRKVFLRLREAKLKLKASKCSFFKKHIQYLGHLVSGDGIEPLPEKLEAVENMPPPKTPKEVRQFLGLVGYYRKFVPKFADIARPLTNLTKQDIKFEWTEKCQKTFQLLKDMLLKEPILKYPDPSKPYTLFTDASKYAWACVLTQEYEHEFDGKIKKILHPITYVSGLFKGSQVNWATLTKEAYAIYMSVKKLPYYLQDADIILRSDHLPLKKFLSKNTLNTKVNNWAVEISPYRIQFEYIKGIKNTLADTMSRLIKITPEIELEPEPTGQEYGYEVFEELQPIETTTCHVGELKEEIQKKKDPIPEDVQPIIDLTEEQLEDIQMKDKFIKNLVNRVVSGKQPSGKPYYIEDRLLKKYIYDNKQRFEVIVVPPNCAAMLLNLAHDQMGHNGSARTYMLLKRLYYWKGMKTDINVYVKQCKLCQKQNIVPVKYSQGHFSAPMVPMEFISMDLIGDFIPSSKGNKYALTVICMLTGYTFCIPIPSKKASDVVTAYVDNVYAKFGGSKKILSDNGTEFKNQLFEKVAKELGVEFKCYTAPYHPQSNGRIEGFHHFLKACMSKHISKTMEWDEVVHLATAAYNFFPNEHSRESPFFLMFGRDPRIPLNTLLQPKIRYMGTDENILSLEALQRIYYMVAENLKLARERQTKQNSYHPTKLKTEDMVMIKTHADGQFQPIYKGYYRIVSFKGNQVQVIPCEGGKPHFVHITDVKYVLPADNIISHIPTFNQFGRKTKLNLNPDLIPDLKWKRSEILNTQTPIIPIKIEKVNTQTTQLTLK